MTEPAPNQQMVGLCICGAVLEAESRDLIAQDSARGITRCDIRFVRRLERALRCFFLESVSPHDCWYILSIVSCSLCVIMFFVNNLIFGTNIGKAQFPMGAGCLATKCHFLDPREVAVPRVWPEKS